MHLMMELDILAACPRQTMYPVKHSFNDELDVIASPGWTVNNQLNMHLPI